MVMKSAEDRHRCDAAYVLDAIAGHDLRDPASSERPVSDLAVGLTGQVGALRAGVLRETLEGVERVTRDDVQRVAYDLFADGALAATVLGAVNGLELPRERLLLG